VINSHVAPKTGASLGAPRVAVRREFPGRTAGQGAINISDSAIGGNTVKFKPLTILGTTTLIIASAAAAIHARQQSTAPKPSPAAPAAAPSPNAAIQRKIETYLRNTYAWGPDFKLKFEPLKETPVPNLYEVKVEVSANGQGDTATFYVTKDGHFLIRAELEDITTDPAVKIRTEITQAGYPSKGPADDKVVLVEYADYECPSCRQLDGILRALLPTQPQVRLIYKDFPLVQIHPWAMTAATAGRCAYRQDPTLFWKFHDALYDNQAIITPENAWQKMQDYATQSGLDATALKVCMADPQAQEDVKKSMSEGESLHITNTPTIFVNGRRLIGPDAATLQQFIRYEATEKVGAFSTH
jgi:protein-disulfide isomerase